MMRFMTQPHSTQITPVVILNEVDPPRRGYTVRHVGDEACTPLYVPPESVMHRTFDAARYYLIDLELRRIAEAVEMLTQARTRIRALRVLETT